MEWRNGTIKRDSIGISVTATLLFYLDTLTSPIPLFRHCHNNIFPFNDLLQYLTVLYTFTGFGELGIFDAKKRTCWWVLKVGWMESSGKDRSWWSCWWGCCWLWRLMMAQNKRLKRLESSLPHWYSYISKLYWMILKILFEDQDIRARV